MERFPEITSAGLVVELPPVFRTKPGVSTGATVSMSLLWQNGQHPSIIRATIPTGFECHDK